MLSLDGKLVYLACGYTDMRKSINGLSAIVEGSFKLDPFEGALFVFCNKSRDRIKILEWDGDGFWLYFKRLEQGTPSLTIELASDERILWGPCFLPNVSMPAAIKAALSAWRIAEVVITPKGALVLRKMNSLSLSGLAC